MRAARYFRYERGEIMIRSLHQKRKFIIVLSFIVIFAGIMIFASAHAQSNTKTPPTVKQLPRIVDVGADKCIPCVMMAPELESLKKEYTGVLEVEFVDVWKKPRAAEPYKVRGIPTQIFYDASGKEIHRHLGYISKSQILETFRKLGIDVDKKPAQEKK